MGVACSSNHIEDSQDFNSAKKEETELEFDPNSPELNDAATKIQATYRGFQTRKRLNTNSVISLSDAAAKSY